MSKGHTYIFRKTLSRYMAQHGFLQQLTGHFSQRFIYNNSKEPNTFSTVYQGHPIVVRYEKDETFDHILHVEHLSSTNVNCYMGFTQLLRDFLQHQVEVPYYDLEVMFTPDFELVRKNHHQRFLSRKSTCLFLEKNTQQPAETNLETTYLSSNIRLYKASMEINNREPDFLWYSMATPLDYDSWDMTTAAFTPISTDMYKQEIKTFLEQWQNIDPQYFNLPPESEIVSILRNHNDWNMNEYLILTHTHLHLVKADVYTG